MGRGAEHMLDKYWDDVGAQYVLTETGGWSSTSRTAPATSR